MNLSCSGTSPPKFKTSLIELTLLGLGCFLTLIWITLGISQNTLTLIEFILYSNVILGLGYVTKFIYEKSFHTRTCD